MKITDVRVLEHERVMPPGMGPPTARINVVTIATDEGIDGHVFVTGPGVDVTPQLVGGAKQLLVGRDPLDIGAIWHDFRLRARMFDPTVQGYVDIALWDIAGKAAGLPVHRLLGVGAHERALVRVVVGAPEQRDVRRRGAGLPRAGLRRVQAASADAAPAHARRRAARAGVDQRGHRHVRGGA